MLRACARVSVSFVTMLGMLLKQSSSCGDNETVYCRVACQSSKPASRRKGPSSLLIFVVYMIMGRTSSCTFWDCSPRHLTRDVRAITRYDLSLVSVLSASEDACSAVQSFMKMLRIVAVYCASTVSIFSISSMTNDTRLNLTSIHLECCKKKKICSISAGSKLLKELGSNWRSSTSQKRALMAVSLMTMSPPSCAVASSSS
mmetsp:Transcript_22725/g.40893  ORF Transcript_22725/g.40893 Transcript_22725/m.40893 type:complete len:201 (-) Transcript_22725:341-943(-)